MTNPMCWRASPATACSWASLAQNLRCRCIFYMLPHALPVVGIYMESTRPVWDLLWQLLVGTVALLCLQHGRLGACCKSCAGKCLLALREYVSDLSTHKSSVQVLIVQFGGDIFSTKPLTAQQWAACTGIGAVTLIVRAGLRLIPPHPQDATEAEEHHQSAQR